MDELEAQIRTFVAHEADGVDPVTAAEAMTGQPAAVPQGRRPRRRHLALGALATAAAVLAGVAIVATTGDDPTEGPVQLRSSLPDTEDWARQEGDPFTLAVPPGWSYQDWQDHCDGSSGALIINQATPIERASEPPGCNTNWDPAVLERPDLVMLLASDDPETPVPGEPDIDEADTEPPLSLEDLRIHQTTPGGTQVRSTGITVDGDEFHHLEAWIGPEASQADIDDLAGAVAGLTWTQGPDVDTTMAFPAIGGPLSTTLLTCLADRGYLPAMEVGEGGEIDGGPGAALTWSDADRASPQATDDLRTCVTAMEEQVLDRQNARRLWPAGLPGPSQSPADAARDQIIGDLAALPLDERAQTWPNEADPFPLLWFVTPTEVWVTVEPPRRPDGADCVIGDPDGAYGTEQVCTHEYAELLRLDHDGNVLAAYPFPGLSPSWLHTTADAVYLGRVGDGGEPSSMVARIDRTTGDAEVVVFPIDETGARSDAVLNVAYDGWRIAPEDLDLTTLVQTGDEGPGTLVQSYTGPVRVQPEALAQLFGP